MFVNFVMPNFLKYGRRFLAKRLSKDAGEQMNGVKLESPGEVIARLLSARGWSQIELAYMLGLAPSTISELARGRTKISAEMAKLLGVAFGKPAKYFVALQARWDLKNAADPNDEVRARVAAQSSFPIREMIKRGWIKDHGKGTGSHGELCRFFGVNSLGDIENISFAARKTGSDEASGNQLAWLYRVRAIAREMLVPAYSPARLEKAINHMSVFKMEPEEARNVSSCLNDAGVRFVVVEGLPGGKIDGVCTWIDSKSPVIGVSLRFDRIDNFWFVLRHECAHVLHRHGGGRSIIDADLAPLEQNVDADEAVADAEAANFCVPTEKMHSFFLRKDPLFSASDVRAFAQINRTHPGLVVGQLQRLTKRYNLLREYLVPIRRHVIPSSMVDGWGTFVPVN
jgi:HTH-type transcriptional regulator / antitoxin HigA